MQINHGIKGDTDAQASLDCLNRLADQLIPNSNLPAWLIEVQHLIKLLQKRVFSRMPL